MEYTSIKSNKSGKLHPENCTCPQAYSTVDTNEK